MRIHIKGGRLIDPANQIDGRHDLYLADGQVAAIDTAPDGFSADQVIDATDRIVIPGLVDLNARLREPGQEHKSTIASETRAAAAGGITTLCVQPDTDPIIDTPAVAELIHHRARQAGYARVVTLGALTVQLQGEHLSEMEELMREGGCIAVSNALQPLNNTLVYRRALEYAANFNLTVFIYANDPWLSNTGCAHEGAISTRLGLPGIPESAETVAVARDLMLIEQTGVRAHFMHLSCTQSIQKIARARHDNLPVSTDVAAHQLYLTEMDIGDFNSACHVIPPLRTRRDLDGLRAGLGKGTINAISSAHQPHDPDAKLAPFCETEPGISALETLLPLTLRLAEENVMSLSDAIARITHEPATILGIDGGRLGVGDRADVCIFDPDERWTVDYNTLASAGKNTPFLGWEMQGRVNQTLLAGESVYQVNL
ncbi:dihydroorotase [Thiohalophilus thiocyanatoxydans]|uniref:Dihydroorotase n=1 Tax=Thiohalophilus thiocyanatoxydans TaxID=381308 RepID=A0A4R8J1T9_9GAMM|nr:dihydroorotase [Thiohalophilus thiocyanatoxydans]TDY04159.1 dihydroorotase [Thiohalophilus thiocyanatoxydans]